MLVYRLGVGDKSTEMQEFIPNYLKPLEINC